MLTRAISARPAPTLAEDVRAGLGQPGQKGLPPAYFYDEIGSALFEAISVLPEYGLTRADERLLENHAVEIVDRLASPVTVAELGSGSGKKTRWILESLAGRQAAIDYYPIEISAAALAHCEKELGRAPSVRVVSLEESYLDGLQEVARRRRGADRLLLLFLGSTIGNFDREAGHRFLCDVRRLLRRGDTLLLGTDLVKEIPRMLLAYDDPLGVTAAFNLNLLARINRELGANFDLSRFRHFVRYDEGERRIEMHLRSTSDQIVRIPAAEMKLVLSRDETIWTESSHKYTAEEIPAMAKRAGFRCDRQWIDREWPFAENLLIAR
jgi:L-histidine N-alpha-methyltransferase